MLKQMWISRSVVALVVVCSQIIGVVAVSKNGVDVSHVVPSMGPPQAVHVQPVQHYISAVAQHQPVVLNNIQHNGGGVIQHNVVAAPRQPRAARVLGYVIHPPSAVVPSSPTEPENHHLLVQQKIEQNPERANVYQRPLQVYADNQWIKPELFGNQVYIQNLPTAKQQPSARAIGMYAPQIAKIIPAENYNRIAEEEEINIHDNVHLPKNRADLQQEHDFIQKEREVVEKMPTLNDLVVFPRDNSLLGEGSFGRVMRAFLRETGEPVAVKRFPHPETPDKLLTWGDYLQDLEQRQAIDDARNECEWGKKIGHFKKLGHHAADFFVTCFAHNMPRLEDALYGKVAPPTKETELFLVMSDGGYTDLESHVPKDVPEVKKILKQLTQGIDFLNRIVKASHHDLKGNNIMWNGDSVKIIDFGGMLSLEGAGENGVSWTPTFASYEFEELPTEAAEETLSSFDIFSLAAVFSEIISGDNVVENYAVFCNSPNLSADRRRLCYMKQKLYYIEWWRLNHEMEDLGNEKMKWHMFRLGGAHAVTHGTNVNDLLLAPSSSEDKVFAASFLSIWRRMFLPHEKRVEAFDQLKRFLSVAALDSDSADILITDKDLVLQEPLLARNPLDSSLILDGINNVAMNKPKQARQRPVPRVAISTTQIRDADASRDSEPVESRFSNIGMDARGRSRHSSLLGRDEKEHDGDACLRGMTECGKSLHNLNALSTITPSAKAAVWKRAASML